MCRHPVSFQWGTEDMTIKVAIPLPYLYIIASASLPCQNCQAASLALLDWCCVQTLLTPVRCPMLDYSKAAFILLLSLHPAFDLSYWAVAALESPFTCFL